VRYEDIDDDFFAELGIADFSRGKACSEAPQAHSVSIRTEDGLDIPLYPGQMIHAYANDRENIAQIGLGAIVNCDDVCVVSLTPNPIQLIEAHYHCQHVDALLQFLPALSENYSAILIDSVSSLVSLSEMSSSLGDVDIKGVKMALDQINQAVRAINTPVVMLNHIALGQPYLVKNLRAFTYEDARIG